MKNGPPRERQAGVDSKDVGAAFGYSGNINLPDFNSNDLSVARLMREFGLSRQTATVVAELAGLGGAR